MPGTEQVDARVAAAAGAREGEAVSAERELRRVFVQGADVGGRGAGEGGAARVGEEGPEGGMVVGIIIYYYCWWWR